MARPPTFSAVDLAAAGLAVVRRSGWDAVSIRSVAAAAGVSPMATYRLVTDADDLRRLVADAAAVPIRPHRGAGDVFAALDDWGHRAHDHLVGLPGLSAHVLATWTELPGWLDIVESLLVAAERDGLRGARAVETVNAVFAFVLARAELHHAAGAGGPRRLAPVRAEPARYPRIDAARTEFAVARTRHHFAAGLSALLTGLRAAADPAATGRGRTARANG